MAFEFLPDWIYTFLILPIAILFQRHFVLSSKVVILQEKDKINDKKFDKLCESIDDLTKEVHELIGRWDEHLRKTA